MALRLSSGRQVWRPGFGGETDILRRLHVAGRNERSPGLAGLQLILSGLPRDRRNTDEGMAGGTLNFTPGKLLVALHMLLTMRAGKLEVAHKILTGGKVDYRRKR